MRPRIAITALAGVICFSSWLQFELLTTMKAVNSQLSELRGTRRGTQPPVKPMLDVRTLGPIDLKGDPVMGDQKAAVAMVEYSDFECPFCARFANDTWPTLEQEYVSTGKIRVFFKHQPLPIHRNARRAAEYAICSAGQGKFWEMHDKLFQAPRLLDESSLQSNARAIGLNSKSLERCLAEEAAEKVRMDQASAEAVGATGTPAFFIGRLMPGPTLKAVRRVSGAVSVDQFRAAINQVLAQSADGLK